MSKTKLTETERERRRQADRERLEQAARELLSSEGWARWVRVRASTGLGRYSLGNQLLISCACAQRGITPKHVTGFRAWLALGRCVAKGQKAIYVFAPISVKERDAGGQETGEKRVFYRSVPVFELAMTEPLPGAEPVPLSPPRQPITGDSHAKLVGPLERLAGELGYSLSEIALEARAPARSPIPHRARTGGMIASEQVPIAARSHSGERLHQVPSVGGRSYLQAAGG